jgi:hypothetical protein
MPAQNGNNPPILVPDGKHKLNINTNAKILFLKEKVLLESHHDAYNTGLLGNGMTGVIQTTSRCKAFFVPFFVWSKWLLCSGLCSDNRKADTEGK